MNKQISKSNCNTCMHYSVCMKCRDPFTYDIIPSVGCNSHTKLVRCKDCKYWEDGYFGYCTKIHSAMEYDAFCSNGERKDNGNP